MRLEAARRSLMLAGLLLAVACSGWVTRDERWPPRGGWNWAVSRELPQLFREFNGIEFGHAHLGETLLVTQDPQRLEQARLEVLEFIFSAPPVPPDEEQIAPNLTRLAWELQRSFNWTHTFHRSLYDLFAADDVRDKQAVYAELLANYLSKPEAITLHPLDLHGKLWSFPESRSFRSLAPRFNSQIWAYHWLQAATYDVQLMGGDRSQRERMPRLIEHYHGYLRTPPVDWEFMPMMMEAAPEFARRFPEAAIIFDNLHMLHDNVDDVLSRPDLYPTRGAQRDAIRRILAIYLHQNHDPIERHGGFHAAEAGHGHGGENDGMPMHMPGPRPPSAREVIEGGTPPPGAPAEHSGHHD